MPQDELFRFYACVMLRGRDGTLQARIPSIYAQAEQRDAAEEFKATEGKLALERVATEEQRRRFAEESRQLEEGRRDLAAAQEAMAAAKQAEVARAQVRGSGGSGW